MPHNTRPSRTILAWCLTVAWCAFIFGMSTENGEASGGMSGSVAQTLIGWFTPGYHTLSTARQALLLDQYQFAVRKCAHFTEYAILGALLLNAVLHTWAARSRTSSRTGDRHSLAWRALTALVLATIYAGSDEFHQLFVSGRSGQVRDVLIDAAGALVGILIAVTFVHMKRKGQPMPEIHLDADHGATPPR